jgi:hypothetical protein
VGVIAHRVCGYRPDITHDGDQLNAIGIHGEDSKKEIRKVFTKRDYYISGSGNLLYDPCSEPVMFMMKAATSGLTKL